MKKIFCIIMLLKLAACSHEPHDHRSHLMTLKSQLVVTTLFYSGTIQPLNTQVITSPADAIVVSMPVQYGAAVHKGQLLFILSSTKFMSDYKAALMTYLKTKSEFNHSKAQLDEANFLHKNELISDDDFKSKQTNYYANQLAFMQAKDILDSLIRQLDLKEDTLYQLSMEEIDKVNQAMHWQTNSNNLRAIAPVNGVLLSPIKYEEANKKLSKGDMIKQGDVLAIIGNMSGIRVPIKVNELTINQLKVGQKAKITGSAFPDDVLEGSISGVEHQGEEANGGQPMFTVEVIVTKLTEKQQKEIHVGMSAKIEIDIETEPRIMVPITALSEKNGEPYVKLFDEQTGKQYDVAVKTGSTTIDSVVIISGLKSGDKIVIPD